MSDEVLFTILFCALGFTSGRLLVSNKEDKRDIGLSLIFLTGAGYLTYIYSYENWFGPGLGFVSLCAIGFFGKDSLKLFLRRRVRPQAKQVVGQWTPKEVVDEEDHSKIGIGS